MTSIHPADLDRLDRDPHGGPSRLRGRLCAAVGATVFGVLLALSLPLPADAHVRVDPGQAQPGGYTTLTFRVPNESATAGTVRLEVDLPTDTPFTSVSYLPVPGWKAEVVTGELPEPVTVKGTTVAEAPLKVVWTADAGTRIEPGQFQQFTISAGPVPETGSILLPATQTYSDGTVVAWDEPTPASGDEPEHPAPTLYIEDAPPASGHHGTPTVEPGAADDDEAASDPVALGIGIGGLALGGLGVVLAAFALARRRGGSA